MLQWYVETEETNLRYCDALQLEDGSYVAMGVCRDPAEHYNLHLTRYDENLNEVEVKHMVVHSNLFSNLSNMLPVPGGFLLACRRRAGVRVLTLLAYDNACNLVNSVSFATSAESVYTCGLCASNQGIFLFASGAKRPVVMEPVTWKTLMYRVN